MCDNLFRITEKDTNTKNSVFGTGIKKKNKQIETASTKITANLDLLFKRFCL